MFELINEIDSYFTRVINDEDFVLGIDKTGVYAFTEESDVDLVLLKFSRMLQTLALHSSDAVLCAISDTVRETAILHVTTLPSLELWIRETVGKRRRIFSEEDIASIVGCYFEGEDDEDSICDLLREFDLPEPVILSLLSERPNSLRDITKYGVPREVAYSVLQVFEESSYALSNVDSSAERGVSVALYSYVKKMSIISFLLAVCALPCVWFNVWWASGLLAFGGVVYGKKAEKVNGDAAAKFAKWANLLILFLSLLPLLQMLFEVVMKWFIQQGFIMQ